MRDTDPDFLKARRCLKEPIPEIFEAAELLGIAAITHQQGDRELAESRIFQADIPVIAEWTESIWGVYVHEIHRRREVLNAPPYLSKEMRDKERMPNAETRRQLKIRDGWHCRFCGIPVIDAVIRKKIHQAYPSAARWGRTNSECHTALQCMWLQFDHVLPHSRGGANKISNIVVTCGPCNFGRAQFTLEELGLLDPRDFAPNHTDWDGLESWK